MLKKPITFENFDGEQETEVHYFNLTKTELIEMELGGPGGSLGKRLANISDEDPAEIVELFKSIILGAYGVRDGNGFMKSKALSETFAHTLAYDALFYELMTNAKASADFITGIVPKDLLDGSAVATVQLPDRKDQELPWADREPTQNELMSMTPEQLRDVYHRKTKV